MFHRAVKILIFEGHHTRPMTPSKIKFNNASQADFITELREQVAAYFKDNNISQYANGAMVLKTIALFAITFGAYALILSNTLSAWGMLGMAVLMGAGTAGIGFSVQHDANHGAYSSNPYVNRILGYSLNLIGGNAFTWKIQHNILHHTFTNIYDMDEDLDAGIVVRLSPNAPHRPHHKYQHYFAFLAYGLVTLMWYLVKDFKKIKRYNGGSNSGYQKAHPASEYVILIISKIVYTFYMIVVPLWILPITWWQFVIGFVVMHLTTGVILSVVFQLAHVVEGPEQPVPDQDGKIDNVWAVHQLQTTSNFAMNNAFINWYVGGLNFQIEHHLFPKICSIHYPALSSITQHVAKKYGQPYYNHKTFFGAVHSHYLLLKSLGQG
jgi:linoleoyl-CoA desaturase